jgi:DNA/RNA-binding domain of Phe-tRNA-synthetase-like protein
MNSQGQNTYLKQHFRDFIQVAYLHAQYEENDFAKTFNTLKHRFIHLTKVCY